MDAGMCEGLDPAGGEKLNSPMAVLGCGVDLAETFRHQLVCTPHADRSEGGLSVIAEPADIALQTSLVFVAYSTKDQLMLERFIQQMQRSRPQVECRQLWTIPASAHNGAIPGDTGHLPEEGKQVYRCAREAVQVIQQADDLLASKQPQRLL